MADGFVSPAHRFLGISILLGLVASRGAGAAAATPVIVVTTNTILADMTAEICGEDAKVHCLIARGAELHGFEPLPADVARLTDAALLVANGAGSEPWLERLVAAAGFNGQLVKAAEACELIVPSSANAGTTAPDPHAWQDPACGLRYVAAIRDALSQVDPKNETRYRERARLYSAQLEVLDSWIRRLLAPLPPERRRFVTSHSSLAYFARAYRLDVIPIRGLDPGHEPDAAQLSRLVNELRDRSAAAIFAESREGEKLLQQLARDTHARLGGYLFTDSLAPSGSPAGTYLGMMRENALTLAEALAP